MLWTIYRLCSVKYDFHFSLLEFINIAIWWLLPLTLLGRFLKLSKTDRLLMCWWAFTGLTHIIIEGYFVFSPEFYKKKDRFYFSEVCKFLTQKLAFVLYYFTNTHIIFALLNLFVISFALSLKISLLRHKALSLVANPGPPTWPFLIEVLWQFHVVLDYQICHVMYFAGKEYSKGDSRYAARDATIVTVEGITAVLEGPASLLAV